MSTAAPARQIRRPQPQLDLVVIRTEWLTPHLVRVVLGGERFAEFQRTEMTDQYVKLVFTEAGVPVTRTYTIRAVDPDARTLSIDFVVHGDEGLAGPWAANAQPGDTLVLGGSGGGYAPDESADWHLFAGDESALPAIAAALDALAETAQGVAFIEAHTAADVIELNAPAGVDVEWLLRGDAEAGSTSLLADAVAGAPWREGRVQVFAHGERGAMKLLRTVFAARALTRDQLSLSGYWAFGRTEDRFQAEKRQPVGIIEPVSD